MPQRSLCLLIAVVVVMAAPVSLADQNGKNENKSWTVTIDPKTVEAAIKKVGKVGGEVIKWVSGKSEQHGDYSVVYEIDKLNVVVVPVRLNSTTRITDNISFDPANRWSDYWVANKQVDPLVRIYVSNVPEGVDVSKLAMQQKWDKVGIDGRDEDKGPQVVPGQPHRIDRGHSKYYAKRSDLWNKLDGKGCYLVIADDRLTIEQLNKLPGIQVKK